MKLIPIIFICILGFTHSIDAQEVRVYPNCLVIKIIDGDTLRCIQDTEEHYIRFRAVDTPEIFFGKNECYGNLSRDYLTGRIYGKYVKVQIDGREKGGDKRELGYIWYEGEMLNLTLILLGYGTSVVNKYPTILFSPVIFSEAEKLARSQNLGLWGACEWVK